MPRLVRFFKNNKAEVSVSAVFLLMMASFIISSPSSFLQSKIYTSVLTTLPISLILTVTAVFIVVSGEIDLSFPAVIGIGAWIFAFVSKATGIPWLGLLLGLAAGATVGMINGLLVTKIELPSLVTTLGMSFILRGLIMIGTGGNGITLVSISKKPFYQIFVGNIGEFPVQMLWGILFVYGAWFLFRRHKFGAHVRFIGDNLTSARETGIKIDKVKITLFVLMGFSSAFVGVLSSLINYTFWPTTGEGYLLLVLAAVFLGGTPMWGGVGTIIGASAGALILGFLETGIITVGLTGFYTQFFFGMIIVLSLVSHRFTGVTRE